MTQTIVFEALPYVDKEPTPEERAAAQSLVQAELASMDTSGLHRSQPPPYEPTFRSLLQQEMERVAVNQRLDAIDLKRYEAQEDAPANVAQLQAALERAYTAQSYLSARHAHLCLLDSFGKNAWLVGNWQAEAELAALERELAQSKGRIELVNKERRQMQMEVGEELKGLNATWRRGVGRVLETELAAEKLQQKLGRQRTE